MKPARTGAGARDEPILAMATAAAWSAWLAEHHGRSRGVLLRLTKRSWRGTATGAGALTYAEALEVALAWGWIDSQKRALDDGAWLQRFTPRGPRSPWSKINRAKAEALIAEGRMRPSGLAEVERAKADGRWDAAYDGAASATVPDDLQRALDASPAAKEAFAKLDAQNRYAILHRTQTAKRPETRARRIATFVAMLERGETLH